eukprot:SAG31_NODE_5256_length_2647_cov_1.875981_2_plen_88_part_00
MARAALDPDPDTGTYGVAKFRALPGTDVAVFQFSSAMSVILTIGIRSHPLRYNYRSTLHRPTLSRRAREYRYCSAQRLSETGVYIYR